MKIILASKSPRRKVILSRLQLPFEIKMPNFIEDQYKCPELPQKYAQRLAREKALSVSCNNKDTLVIGADTIVLLDEKVIGKPKNQNDARKTLNKLSNTTHHVITAVSIQINSKKIDHTFHSKTAVTFNKLNENDILKYINSNAPFDKAGSYGIQDFSSIFVKKIDGCYDNVVGFPLSQFCLEIKKIGVNLS